LRPPNLLVALVLVAVAPMVGGGASSQPLPGRGSFGALRASAQAGASLPAEVTKGHDSLELLGQSTWVGPGQGDFRMDLGVTASDAALETIAVDVYPELYTRSAF
jgi:hypothetical protein